MNLYKYRASTRWLGAIVLLASILACNLTKSATPVVPPAATIAVVPVDTVAAATAASPTDTQPAATLTSTTGPTSTPIVHVMKPADPPVSISSISDNNSSTTAAQRRANGGDSFNINLFERPFTSNAMEYQPDLDITSAKLSEYEAWVYVTITVSGKNPAGGLTGDYGAEVDVNMDGRGDLLVMAAKPGPAWSTDGVRLWTDPNKDVGSAHPVISDPPASNDGYETLAFNAGVGADPDAAWARLSPSDPTTVQIAFKAVLINNADKYMWGAWAMDDSTLNPAWFDFNDHFTPAQAGSPLIEDTQNYPLKALAKIDNTCRWVVGFAPTGAEPGICPVPATPTPVPPTPTVTRTPTVAPGKLSGIVYDNGINGGLSKIPGSIPRAGITVTVKSGACGSGGGVLGTQNTNGSGAYYFILAPGTYCVSAAAPTSTQTGPQTVDIAPGGGTTINFFYYTKLT